MISTISNSTSHLILLSKTEKKIFVLWIGRITIERPYRDSIRSDQEQTKPQSTYLLYTHPKHPTNKNKIYHNTNPKTKYKPQNALPTLPSSSASKTLPPPQPLLPRPFPNLQIPTITNNNHHPPKTQSRNQPRPLPATKGQRGPREHEHGLRRVHEERDG